MKRRFSCFLFALLLAASPAAAITRIMVVGSVTSADCGGGLHTFTGSHRADIMDVEPQHQNKTWSLSGSLFKCGFLFDFPHGGICQKDGNTSSTSSLYCETQTDLPCQKTSLKARTFSTVVNHSDTAKVHFSGCYQNNSCINPDLLKSGFELSDWEE